MKQSSVEWLINEIDMQFPHIDIRWKERMIEQAKAMHKEEIGDAHYDGQIEGFTGIPSNDLAKKYYNETFGE